MDVLLYISISYLLPVFFRLRSAELELRPAKGDFVAGLQAILFPCFQRPAIHKRPVSRVHIHQPIVFPFLPYPRMNPAYGFLLQNSVAGLLHFTDQGNFFFQTDIRYLSEDTFQYPC